MPEFLRDRTFRLQLVIFILFNLFFYLFLLRFNSLIPFNFNSYRFNAHHFETDPKSVGRPFNLFSGLAQFDAQWYLKIASDGYPYNPHVQNDLTARNRMQNLVFAFFPLYPMLIRIINFLFASVDLSAFITTNLLLISDFISLYYLVSRFYSKELAVKTVWLMFLYPFSVFFRSFFAEGLLLLLIIWFVYFLRDRRYFISALLLGLSNITKGTAILLNLVFLFYLVRDLKNHRLSPGRFISSLLVTVLPLTGWLVFNYFKTGNPFYFSRVLSSWFVPPPGIPYLIYNLAVFLSFFQLPLHFMHFSQIDCSTLIILSVLLVSGYKHLNRLLWWTSFCIFLTPLLVHDLSSYSRYQIISFPVFIYLAKISNPWVYRGLLLLFAVGLFALSLYFVNWYWVG